jgi:4-carboxymuconolactone decarboxylase
MTGTSEQLRFHLSAAMNTGLTEAQMKNFMSVLEKNAGKMESDIANHVLMAVVQNRK